MKHDSGTKDSFDVIVVGAGHAGIEAACAAARIGAEVALITKSREDIGVLSCNPAIGGLGKGQIVREVDALGGVMAQIADRAGIQFRVLNRSRGAAARGPRAQMDRALYKSHMQDVLASISWLHILEGMATEILLDGDKVAGLQMGGRRLNAASVVVTTGTFLRGKIHIGAEQYAAGRIGESPSIDFAESLGKELSRRGAIRGRLKTGTPARLSARTIDFSKLEPQYSDEAPQPFSYLSDSIQNRLISCHITRTTEETHRIIREEIPRSPLFNGAIDGRGPRYCPSIEDKVTRFSDRSSHQIFLEPEGLASDLIYPNGISTSFSREAQARFIATIPGLEEAVIVQPGYAVEYDFFQPNGLNPSLESKFIEGLFLAGQINGTTGYEEAAGQGLVAGANAALKAALRPSFILSRTDSYIGVMIDDLTAREISEPYRMFTSRSEYRLNLRADNADFRLTPVGDRVGLIDRERQTRFSERLGRREALERMLADFQRTPTEWNAAGFHVNEDGIRRSAWEILARPDVSLERLAGLVGFDSDFARNVADSVESGAKYSVYLNRQQAAISEYRSALHLTMPPVSELEDLPGLSSEIRLRLHEARPKTLAHAQRLEGMTPAALALLAGAARRFSAAG